MGKQNKGTKDGFFFPSENFISQLETRSAARGAKGQAVFIAQPRMLFPQFSPPVHSTPLSYICSIKAQENLGSLKKKFKKICNGTSS